MLTGETDSPATDNKIDSSPIPAPGNGITITKLPPGYKPHRATKRKITLIDLEEMARLMTKRVNETGACLILGILPQTWFNWKRLNGNLSKFTEILTRIRETKLNSTIDAIDQAGDDYQIETKDGSYTKRGDWRAKAWLAERVLAPERFNDGQGQAEQGMAQAGPVIAMLAKVYASLPNTTPEKRVASDMPAIEAQVMPEPAKALPETSPDWHRFNG